VNATEHIRCYKYALCYNAASHSSGERLYPNTPTTQVLHNFYDDVVVSVNRIPVLSLPTAVILCFNNRDFRNYGCRITGILRWSGTDTTIEVRDWKIITTDTSYQIPTVLYRTNTVFSHKPMVTSYLLEGNKYA
jgi:hypothetical protein